MKDEKIKVLVVGCNGAMGQIVCRLVFESDDMEIYAGFDKVAREHSNFPVIETIDELKNYVNEHGKPDVAIDFSHPDNTVEMIKAIYNHFPIPTVIATTGFTEQQLSVINYCAEHQVTIFRSNNMSYEIKLLCDLLKELAPRLYGTHDIEIEETHHNRKKDAPSGTAKTLAEAINESLGSNMNIVYGREGKREPNEIGVSSLRGGNVVGVHTIHFFGQSDELEITHRAFSREMFAEGALKAARFIINQPCGRVYGMDDLQ